MSRDYRIVKKVTDTGEDQYGLYEVYYTDDPVAHTPEMRSSEPVEWWFDSPEELKACFDMMIRDINACMVDKREDKAVLDDFVSEDETEDEFNENSARLDIPTIQERE